MVESRVRTKNGRFVNDIGFLHMRFLFLPLLLKITIYLLEVAPCVFQSLFLLQTKDNLLMQLRCILCPQGAGVRKLITMGHFQNK
jgi:hypothetical protein